MFKNKMKEKLKQLITLGKKRGYLTYNEIAKEIIDYLEGEDCKEELLDKFYNRLVELGIKTGFLDPISEKLLERKKQELLEYLIPIGKARGYLTYEEIYSGFLDKITYEEKISGCLEESKSELYTKIEEKGIKIVEQNTIKKQEFFKKILTIGKERGYLTYNEIDELYLGENYLVYNDINELYTKIEEKGIKIVEQNLKVDDIKRRKQELLEKLLSIEKEKGYITYNEINNELFKSNLNYTKENRKYISSIYRTLAKLEIKIFDRLGEKLFGKLIYTGKIQGYVFFDDIREEIYEKNLKVETIIYFHAIQKKFGFKVIIDKESIFNYLSQLLTNLNYKNNTSEEKLVPLQNNEKISNDIIDNNLGILFENNNGDISLKSKDSAFDNIFNKLDERKKDIIISRYYYGMSLGNIGKKYKITRQRTKQILAEIERKLDREKSKCIAISLESKDSALDNIFNKLDEKQKAMIIMRYYYRNTLDDIGREYKITRERARQILVKTEKILFNKNKLNINRFVLEFKKIVSSLNIVTKKELCKSLKKYGSYQLLEIYLNYFIHESKYEYIKDKDFIVSDNINLNKIKKILESTSIVTIEYIYKQLEIKFKISSEVIDRVFSILNKFMLKKGYFINPTLPNKILYLFYIEQRPIHISELENLYKREFNSTNVMHTLHAHVQKMNEIFRYDRGTYVLKESINDRVLNDTKLIKNIEQLMKKKNVALHINVIKQNLFLDYSLLELRYLLESNKRFKTFGRDYYGLKTWKMKQRKHIKDLVYRYIKRENKPTNTSELVGYLQKYGKSIQEPLLHSLMSKYELLKKIAPNVWGLVEWKQYSTYESINIQKNIKDKIINYFLRNGNIHLTGQALFEEMRNFFCFKSSASIYNNLKDNSIFEKTESGYKLTEEYFNNNKLNYTIQLKDIPKVIFNDFYKCLKEICCSSR